jgi:hypothetical protein
MSPDGIRSQPTELSDDRAEWAAGISGDSLPTTPLN